MKNYISFLLRQESSRLASRSRGTTFLTGEISQLFLSIYGLEPFANVKEQITALLLLADVVEANDL